MFQQLSSAPKVGSELRATFSGPTEALALALQVLTLPSFGAILGFHHAHTPWTPTHPTVPEEEFVEEQSIAETAAAGRAQPTHGILVVANETVAGQALLRAIESRLRGPETRVTVVSPALTGRLRRWFSDVDRGVANASQRLELSLAELAKLGVAAEGHIGDTDPLQAIDDALRLFTADEIIISTHPRGRSNWLERRVVERAADRFGLPITHVIVDLEREDEVVRALPQEAPL